MTLHNKDGGSTGAGHTGFTYKGKEIVLQRKRGPKANMGKEIWGPSEEKRVEVATVYAVCGHIDRTAELTGISNTTVRKWRREEWFQKVVDEVRNENDEKIDVKFTEIVEKSLELVIEKLKNGDTFIDKFGRSHQKPISARDTALIAAIMIDKRNLLRGRPTSRTEQVTNAQQLTNLAEQFAKIANKQRVEVIDAEYVEVVDAKETGTSPETPSEVQGTVGGEG